VKYVVTIFATAVITFLAATIYYKGLPTFYWRTPSSVSTESAVLEEVAAPQPTPDETESLRAAIKAALTAKHGPDAATLNITVSKIEGDFAQGGAAAQAGGGMWLAAKVNGIWLLVWDGNGQINCSDLASYPTFPVDLVPECWDTTTKKIVKR
jgi:hypothetical protein